ncbi:MAG: FHA domain-containing protein, partial [Armatimonadota bacterium]|nr:FHA domain-containing protein [Armatimonadota bacterium]
MIRVVRCTFAATLGALIAWGSMEWTPLLPESRVPGVEVVIPYKYLFVVGLVSGFLIGIALGIAEAVGTLSPRNAQRGILMGALVGAGGGVVGITLGNAVYNAARALSGGSPYEPSLPANLPPEAKVPSVPGPIAFILMLIGRSLGWAIIGAFIGLSQGIATSSIRRMVNGTVGGFIGGGLGGCIFEILVWLNKGGVANFPPELIRFISFGSTGAAIGLFIGLAGELAKQAWLVRFVGINEGKQFVLEKPETVLGRSELVDIPVFGDPDVAERHAMIVRQGERFYIEDLGSYAGTWVNDVRISKEILKDRDTITIGKTRFLFREKSTEQLGFAPTSFQGTHEKIPASPHVCPFCGSPKDAAGNCQCSVVSESPRQPTASTSALPQQSYQPTQPLNLTFPAPTAIEQPKLVALAGPYAGQAFVLKPDITEIGREAGKDISLSTDNAVSRRH